MLEIIICVAIGMWCLKEIGIDLKNPKTREALISALNNNKEP